MRNFDFFDFFGVFGVFDLCFLGDPEISEIRGFFDLADPGCPGDPMVGPHTDCVASWDTVGGIQALGGPQEPLQTGFGVAGFGSFARQIWLKSGENFTGWILPDPGCPGDPKVGSHSDCVVSWDTVGGIQALGCPHGPPQTGFGVAQDGPVEVLALFVRQNWLENGENFVEF